MAGLLAPSAVEPLVVFSMFFLRQTAKVPDF
jgi:hypothetical protein